MVRHRRLRQADRPLDVARAQPPLVAGDQVAAGPSPRLQQLEDLQPRRIAQRLAGGHDVEPRRPSSRLDADVHHDRALGAGRAELLRLLQRRRRRRPVRDGEAEPGEEPFRGLGQEVDVGGPALARQAQGVRGEPLAQAGAALRRGYDQRPQQGGSSVDLELDDADDSSGARRDERVRGDGRRSRPEAASTPTAGRLRERDPRAARVGPGSRSSYIETYRTIDAGVKVRSPRPTGRRATAESGRLIGFSSGCVLMGARWRAWYLPPPEMGGPDMRRTAHRSPAPGCSPSRSPSRPPGLCPGPTRSLSTESSSPT